MHLARLFWPVVPTVAKPKQQKEPLVPSYQVHSLRAVTELMGYLRAVDEALPHIKVPSLIMHARGDTEVPADNLDYIYDRLGSKHKEKVWIENGSHVVTEDSDKEFVYERVESFLAEQVG
jgi:esterase/lipase